VRVDLHHSSHCFLCRSLLSNASASAAEHDKGAKENSNWNENTEESKEFGSLVVEVNFVDHESVFEVSGMLGWEVRKVLHSNAKVGESVSWMMHLVVSDMVHRDSLDLAISLVFGLEMVLDDIHRRPVSSNSPFDGTIKHAFPHREVALISFSTELRTHGGVIVLGVSVEREAPRSVHLMRIREIVEEIEGQGLGRRGVSHVGEVSPASEGRLLGEKDFDESGGLGRHFDELSRRFVVR